MGEVPSKIDLRDQLVPTFQIISINSIMIEERFIYRGKELNQVYLQKVQQK
jgi:hypothetical protein